MAGQFTIARLFYDAPARGLKIRQTLPCRELAPVLTAGPLRSALRAHNRPSHLVIRKLAESAQQSQCASPSQEPQGRICWPGIFVSSEQVGHGHPKHFGCLCETARADAAHTLLVFLDLLNCDAERVPEGVLGHPHRQPLNADTLADLYVHSIWSLWTFHR
jgi:hypothetical protein